MPVERSSSRSAGPNRGRTLLAVIVAIGIISIFFSIVTVRVFSPNMAGSSRSDPLCNSTSTSTCSTTAPTGDGNTQGNGHKFPPVTGSSTNEQSPSASPTPTPSSSASPTPTPSSSASPTPTPSSSATLAPKPCSSASPTPTPSSSATLAPTPSSSASPTPTPSSSATLAPTPSSSASPTPTPSSSASPTQSQCPSIAAGTPPSAGLESAAQPVLSLVNNASAQANGIACILTAGPARQFRPLQQFHGDRALDRCPVLRTCMTDSVITVLSQNTR